jgi:outer membrane receptor protein involved in Fe transport
MRRTLATLLLGSAVMPVLCAPADAAVSSSIETVVVTAEKRVESLKDVPMSVTSVGEDTLDKLDARSFEDYFATVPGLTLLELSSTKPHLVLRGINAGGDGATVGTYLDETPYGSSSALANALTMAPNLDTFDISRVEVLRGPQGTLYGANTLGGLLKFVTNAPDPAGFAAKAEAGGNTLDNGGAGAFIRGMVNVPLGDDVAVRGVGYYTFDPGWIDDPGRGLKNINGVHSKGGRLSALYRPDDKISIRLTAVLQDISANNNNEEDVTVVGGQIVPLYGDYQQQRTVNSFDTSRYGIYNATIDWDLDFATLTSATSYGTFHSYQFTDATGTFGLDVQALLRVNKFTQEARLASDPDGGPLDWLVGIYYTNEVAALHQDLVFAPHGPPLGFLEVDSGYSEIAGFGDVTYHFTPEFDVSLGGRYSNNSQHATQSGLATGVGNSTGDVFTWSTAANYKVTGETSLYARVAKGYRPGGPNVLPIGNPAGAPAFYGADSLVNYEAGVKTDLLDGRLSLDADVFYIDWSDIQLLTVINSTGVDINGGSARSLGFEWDTRWQPLDELSLGFSGAYVDANLTEDTPAIVGGVKGDALPFSPRWSFSVDGDYHVPVDCDWKPYFGGTLHYIGKRMSDFQAGASQVQLPDYTTLELRAGVEWHNWDLSLYGKNLSGAKGMTFFSASGNSAASGNAASVAVIAPRMFGLVLRAKL